MRLQIFRKNDNVVEWAFLAESTDGEFINSATVTFTLYSGYALNSATGVLLATTSTVNVVVAGPTTMSYVTGSNGKYQGKLPASVDLDLSKQYTLEINASGGGHIARRSIPVTVIDRES